MLFFIKRLLFYGFQNTHTFYILYLTVIVLSYYISVKAYRCHYVNRICLAHLYMYNYTTFIFFMFPFCVCFKYDAYVNLKLFEYKEKRIMRRSKGCTCISLVRHSDYSLPGTLIRHCSCCGYFVRSKKKITIHLINS